MRYPKMILFDYEHTLLYEPDWNADKKAPGQIAA